MIIQGEYDKDALLYNTFFNKGPNIIFTDVDKM